LRSLGATGFDAGVTTPEKLLPYAEQVLYDHPRDLQLIHAYDRPPALPKLIQELYDTDFARAYRASLTLIEEYPNEAGPALLETYIQQAREDYGGHYHVMKLLGWLKYAPGYETLLEGLNISAPQFMKSRAAAAIALGELGNPDAIPALVTCLDSKLWDLRFSALVALEKLGHRDGLAGAIDDPDWMVQTKAQSLTRGK
jgi:bilin biosynthesis protein